VEDHSTGHTAQVNQDKEAHPTKLLFATTNITGKTYKEVNSTGITSQGFGRMLSGGRAAAVLFNRGDTTTTLSLKISDLFTAAEATPRPPQQQQQPDDTGSDSPASAPAGGVVAAAATAAAAKSSSYKVRDVVGKHDLGVVSNDTWSAEVPSHAVAFVVFTPNGSDTAVEQRY
jgi:hypothetical protein